MSCNFSDRFFVMNCGLCIFGLLCKRKHSYTLTLTYSYHLSRHHPQPDITFIIFSHAISYIFWY